MPTFEYEVLTAPNQHQKGRVEAESRGTATRELGRRGFHILSLTEATPSRFRIRRHIRLKQLAFITRQLARLIKAGVPLMKALRILEDQMQDRASRDTLEDLRGRVREGKNLSAALEAHPLSFGPWYVSMVRAGETGGMLEEALQRLSEGLEREVEMRSRVRAALAYPILMIAVGLLTVFILLSFVIPKMTVLFDEAGRALPLPTLILIGISDFFSSYWWAILLGCAAAALMIHAGVKTEKGGLWADGCRLKFPYFGALILKRESARFARVLGTLIGNGVSILQGLEVTAATLANRILSMDAREIAAQIRQGGSLSKQLEGHPRFPPMMSSVAAVGEQSGSLDQSLLELAEEYDGDVERAVRTMIAMLEPLMIIAVGGAVGFIVAALLMPIFELNQLIQ